MLERLRDGARDSTIDFLFPELVRLLRVRTGPLAPGGADRGPRDRHEMGIPGRRALFASSLFQETARHIQH